MKSKDLFKTMVWAGVNDLKLSFDDAPEHKVHTGFAQMKEVYPNAIESVDQFITRFYKV